MDGGKKEGDGKPRRKLIISKVNYGNGNGNLWLPQSTFSSGHSGFICNLVDGGNNNNNSIKNKINF